MSTAYATRINRVIDHIDAHLDHPLDLRSVAALAHFSPWHFHRIFQALTGETLANRVRRRRAEAAAQRLLAKPPVPVSTIAVDLGFASAEVFSRVFRAHFGMSATQWRKGGSRRWAQDNRQRLSKIHQELSKPSQVSSADNDEYHGMPSLSRHHQPSGPPPEVEYRSLAAGYVAYLRHVGPYGHPNIGVTWERFARWCGLRGLPAPGGAFIGIAQDNPEITRPEHCRYDCCVEVPRTVQPDGEVGIQPFAGGRYACAAFQGKPEEIHEAWMRLYGEWLPSSGWQPDDSPAIEVYELGGSAQMKPGELACLLCLPIRPL